MTDEISIEESMRQCLLYFESAVHSVAMSPQEIYEEFGEHEGVAWELRQELLSGKPLLGWGGISGNDRNLIEKIISATEQMPSAAFDGTGMQDLLDPSWASVREVACKFINSSDRVGH